MFNPNDLNHQINISKENIQGILKNHNNSTPKHAPVQILYPQTNLNINDIINNYTTQLKKHFTIINNNAKQFLGVLWHIKNNQYIFLAANYRDSNLYFTQNLGGVKWEKYITNVINLFLTNKLPTILKNSLNKNTQLTNIAGVYKKNIKQLQLKKNQLNKQLLQIVSEMAQEEKHLKELNDLVAKNKSLDISKLDQEQHTKDSLQVTDNTIIWNIPYRNVNAINTSETKKKFLNKEVFLPEIIAKIHLNNLDKESKNVFSLTSHNQYLRGYESKLCLPHLIYAGSKSPIKNMGCLGSNLSTEIKVAATSLNINYLIDIVDNFSGQANLGDGAGKYIEQWHEAFTPIKDHTIKMIKIAKKPKVTSVPIDASIQSIIDALDD